MDLLDDPNFKVKYQKNKLRVKLWESDFMEKYGRRPNKNDIRAADNAIKESYKMYWKLKTQALEETLLDITFSDDVQANVSANTSSTFPTEEPSDQIDKSPSLDKSLLECPMKNLENINPEKTDTFAAPKAEFSAVAPLEETPNVDGAWGDHLNRENEPVEPVKKKNLIGRSSSFQLSQKMFSSSSLTKRNPRKSLSMNKLKNSKSDLNSTSAPIETNSDKSDGYDVAKVIFGESVKVVHEETKITAQPINAIQQLIKGGASLTRRTLNHGWLDRCSRENNLEPITYNSQRLSGGTSDSGVDSMDTSDTPTHFESSDVRNIENSPDSANEEDFICPSDSEEERRSKRVRNFKKRLSDGACERLVKRQRLEMEESFSQPLPSISTDDLSKTKIFDESSALPVGQSRSRINVSGEEKICSMEPMMSKTPSALPVRQSRSQINVSKEEKISIEPMMSKASSALPVRQSRSEINVSKEEKIPIEPMMSKAPRALPVRQSRSQINISKEEKNPIEPMMSKAPRALPVRQSRSQKNVSKEEKIPIEPTKADAEYLPPADKIESESDEKEEPNVKKKVRKTARATRSTRSTKAKSTDSRESTRPKKTPAARKRVTRKSKQIEEPSDDETPAETRSAPDIPIYGVEATQVVPRFALPTSASGDLVSDFTRSVAPGASSSSRVVASAKPKSGLTDREKLEAKVAAGRVNENFVRVNIKKKVFVRGKKNFNFSKYRKNQWKQRKKDLSSSEAALDSADFAEKSGGACFKCGGTGHFARRCTAMKSDELLPIDGDEPSEFPTLEEVERMANKDLVMAHCSRMDRIPERPSFSQAVVPAGDPKTSSGNDEEVRDDDDEDYEALFDGTDFDLETEKNEERSTSKFQGHKIPEELLAKLLPPETGAVEPVYKSPSETTVDQTPGAPADVLEALRMFGHDNFRPGQEKAVMRILSGQSTLVTLSTGSGKSLCYQLPAYIYARKSRCITLVVSPLVSLMDDQVVGVPSFLSAAALHTGQTASTKDKIMATIREGKLDILLVSPEAVVAGEKSTGFGALLRQLPPIAFACIDEAHCISQWSHNFRPSYLMICRVLMEKLGVKTILGLTATATKSTAESIVKHLNIRDGMDGVISDTPMPKNLTLTVSKDELRDRALIELLQSERFKECDSIIVYCTRREECTRIAGVLRVSLQDPKNPEPAKAKCSSIAEAYHAGLPASRRKIIQKHFMSGKTRVVVATVAFGMGINKANIRSVIHYNMPASFEGYVQEVGRAGRDNLPAHCHLFLSPSMDQDKWELRRHIFANGVDRHMIRRLLQRIFVPCSCPRAENRTDGKRCPGHEVAIPVDETVRALDISEETIATLLCYLELHPKRFVTVLSSVYVNAKVSSYAGPKALKIAAQSSPPLAMAIALDMKNGVSHDDSVIVEFPVVDIAAAIGWDSGVVKSHLKNLEWQTVDGRSKRSSISVRYDTLGLRVRAPGDLTDAELDEALEALASRAQAQETSALLQLETIHASLSKFSLPSVRQCMHLTEDNTSKSESLKEIIREYFRSDNPLSIVELPSKNTAGNEAEITGDVRGLLCSYRDNNFTGRAVARIFHGIQSPNYSALVWSRCRYWRSHLSTDFNLICRIATKEILAMR